MSQGPGEEVEEYDVLMEVDTETLTEEAYKVDEFAGKVTLLVEAQVSPPCALFILRFVLPRILSTRKEASAA